MKKCLFLSVLVFPFLTSCGGSGSGTATSDLNSAQAAVITATVASSQTSTNSIEELVGINTPSGPSDMMQETTMQCAGGGTRTRSAVIDNAQTPESCMAAGSCQMTFTIVHNACKETMSQCSGSPEYTTDGTITVTVSLSFSGGESGSATVQRTIAGTLIITSALANSGQPVSCDINSVLTVSGSAQAPAPSSITFTGTMCGKTYDDIKTYMEDDTAICVAG